MYLSFFISLAKIIKEEDHNIKYIEYLHIKIANIFLIVKEFDLNKIDFKKTSEHNL